MARRRLWRNDVVRSYWRTRHPLLRFLCLHEAATSPFVVAISDPNYYQRLFICTSATASVELCSPRGEVPWNFAAVCHRARVSSLAKTHTVSVFCVWAIRMHVRRFMGPRTAKFATISVSLPSALGLRIMNANPPNFHGAHRAPTRRLVRSRPRVRPRPLVEPRAGVRMSSSRRWRVSRQASPFLSLPLPIAHVQIRRLNFYLIFSFLAQKHVISFLSG